MCVGRRKRGSAVLYGRRAPRHVTMRRSANDGETVYDTGGERLAAPSLATTRCSRRMPSHAVQGESYRNNQNQSQTHFGASPTPTAQQPLADTRRDNGTLPQKFVQQADGSEKNQRTRSPKNSTKGETEPPGHRACGNVCEVDAQKGGEGGGGIPPNCSKWQTNIAGQAAGGRESDAKQHGRKQARPENAEQARNATKTQQDNRRNKSPSSKRKKPRHTDHLNPSPPPPTLATPALSHIILPHAAFPSQTLSSTVFFNAPPAANVPSSTRQSPLLHSAQRAKAATEGEIKKKGVERGTAATSLSLQKQVSERVRKIK